MLIARFLARSLVVAFAAASSSAFAAPDELQVHLDETTAVGQLSVDVISTYTPSGSKKVTDEGLRATAKLLQFSPEFSYGIGKHSHVGLQLFSAIDTQGRARIDGARASLAMVPFRPDSEDEDGLFVGGIVEAGRLPRTLSVNRADAEVKFIFGYRVGRWLTAVNPEVGLKLAGSGSSSPDLSAKAKLGYAVVRDLMLGIEHYGDLGRLRHAGRLNQQSQQTFAVVDFKRKGIDVNVGIGRGWTLHSDRWTAKAIVSLPL